MKVKLNIFIFINLIVLLASCHGLNSSKEDKTENIVIGDTVLRLGHNIMTIFQDSKNDYWFGSWETGVYKYDGITIVNYTTKHGLLNNRIDEIKEDKHGNIYFSSANASSAISKFNGLKFITLKAIPSENWKLDSTDMWFKYSFENTGKVYRYDGTTLFELQLPNPPNLSNPFAVYSIYKDQKKNIWFGTNPVGVCRYDGQSFQWITEEDVTEFRNEGANGVRSITEDKYGNFWFNTEYRYSVYDSNTLKTNNLYTRHKSIGGLDGKKDSNLEEYLSTVMDNHNNLWFVTYLDGVWKYDGMKTTHYNIQEESKQIALFSIYKDNNGNLWLGTHENGAYKFNGKSFEAFTK
ncbi:MAG: two-component regulator propeller domain-containing protein [Bacteroidota bacterium]